MNTLPDAVSTPEKTPPRWYQHTWVQLILMALVILSARSSLGNHYQIPSGSMEPTLRPGDYVTVDMRAFGLSLPFTRFDILPTGEPKRGDIAVFASPKTGVRLIKRVVAIAGDRVELHAGHLLLNGKSLSSPLSPNVEVMGSERVPLNLEDGGGSDIDNVTVPAGHVLLLGDHRGKSADGRYFGFVKVNALYGRAARVYWRTGDGLVWIKI